MLSIPDLTWQVVIVTITCSFSFFIFLLYLLLLLSPSRMPTTAALTALVVSIGGSINKGFPYEQSHRVQHLHSTLLTANCDSVYESKSSSVSQLCAMLCHGIRTLRKASIGILTNDFVYSLTIHSIMHSLMCSLQNLNILPLPPHE